MKTSDVAIAVAIVLFSLFLVWHIQDCNTFHPEIPEHNYNIP